MEVRRAEKESFCRTTSRNPRLSPASLSRARVLSSPRHQIHRITSSQTTQINSKGSVMLSIRCRGLWRECVWDKFVKIWTCDIFSSYLNPHPASIVVTRSLMITSSIASVAAFLCLLLGFRHFHYCRDAMRRRQLQRLTAALYFLVGVSSTGAIIRYCVYVYYIHQYEVSLKIPGFPSFEYGYSLWMAVGATLGALSSAIISTYESCCKKIKNKEGTKEGPSQAKQTISTYV